MAITAVFDLPGVTSDQYDQVIKGLEEIDLGAPDGRLYHVASPTLAGWLVVDVWESEQQLGAFAESLMPLLAQAGIEAAPQVHPVHNIIRG